MARGAWHRRQRRGRRLSDSPSGAAWPHPPPWPRPPPCSQRRSTAAPCSAGRHGNSHPHTHTPAPSTPAGREGRPRLGEGGRESVRVCGTHTHMYARIPLQTDTHYQNKMSAAFLFTSQPIMMLYFWGGYISHVGPVIVRSTTLNRVIESCQDMELLHTWAAAGYGLVGLQPHHELC